MSTKIKLLKAYHGDCFLIRTFDLQENPINILVDGGPSNTFSFSLRAALEDIKVIDLLILTHIDSDHIGGLINFVAHSRFRETDVRKLWVNCGNLLKVGSAGDRISYSEGKLLEEWLIDHGLSKQKISEKVTTSMEVPCIQGIFFEILSPTDSILDHLIEDWPELSKDYQQKLGLLPISGGAASQLRRGTLEELAAAPFQPKGTIGADLFNSSSIAFILRTPDLSILMLADSRPEVIAESLTGQGYNTTDKRLKVDYVKVSHHGSRNNTSNDVLDLIDCSNFIFSTNGGSGRSKHPDRETIARILYHPQRNNERRIRLYFNYPLADIKRKSGTFFTAEELEKANAEFFDNVSQLP